MKKLLLLWLMIAPMSGMAQNESTPQDTTLYVNGRKIVIKEQGDKIKVKLYESASGGDTITNAQIFEGVYLNGQSTESRTVLSALPFSKKNNKRNRFEPHAGGFYIGYTRLSNDFLSFNPSNGADLNTSHSWEIGGNLFTGSHAFAPTYNLGDHHRTRMGIPQYAPGRQLCFS